MNVFYHWLSRAIHVVLVSLLLYAFPVNAQQNQKTKLQNTGNQNLNKTTNSNQNASSVIRGLLEDNITQPKSGVSFPSIWESPVNTGFVHGMLVWPQANPRINDLPLQENDYIGGFYQDDNGEYVCGGAYPWNPELGIVFALFGDDPDTPEKDGFSFGELIQFRFFSQQTQKDYIVDFVEYKDTLAYVTNGKWYKSGISIVLDMQAEEQLDFYIHPSDNPICINDQLTLEATEHIGTGGTYTYEWTSDPPGFNYTVPNPPAVSPLENTTYFLTVHDGDLVSQHALLVVVNDVPSASAGDDVTQCDNENINLQGSATNYSSILWTTQGDGSFASNTQLTTEYVPGAEDKANGSITLTLTAQPMSPCTVSASDDLLVTLHPSPSVEVGPTTNTCENMSADLEAFASNYSDVEWTTEGNGTFSDPASLSTSYTPGSYGNSHGSVDLTVTVGGISPCSVYASATTTLVINQPAFTYAGPDATICKNETFQTSASAAYYGSAEWMTNGDGYFENPNTLNTVYHPGEEDKAGGLVRLTLVVYSIAPCTGTDFDRLYLHLNDDPVVALGDDMTICGNEVIDITAEAANYSSLTWETGGDGTFVNTSGNTTGYEPGTNDIASGSVEISAFAEPLAPCTQSAGDAMMISFLGTPQVDAGNDLTICSSNFAYLNATAQDYISLAWTTSGDGYFQDAGSLTTKYFPGENDIAAGEAILTLNAAGAPPCQAGQSDQLVVSIVPAATAYAGDDQSTCENQPVQLTANATNFSSLTWSTSGDGTFDSKFVTNTVYTPGPTDIENGEVNLVVSVTSQNPCSGGTSDEVNVFISKQAEANAGNDATICESSVFTTDGQASDYAEILWQSSGDGTFADASALITEYTPGPADIASGNATISLTASSFGACQASVSDEISLQIHTNPFADAGSGQNICENSPATLNGTAGHYSSIAWSTSGDGYFSNPNTLNPDYYPGDQDKTNGHVILTLTANPLAACTTVATGQTEITIEKAPVADAGEDITICEGDNVDLNAVAEYYSSLNWSSTGSGIFENPGALQTQYTPSAEDISNGEADLCLIATSQGTCPDAEDCLHITIVKSPFVFAGDDALVPYGSAYQLSDAQAGNFDAVMWSTTDGTGSFDDPTQVNAAYTPGEEDLNLQFVHLTLQAEPLVPCQLAAEDEVVLEVSLDCQNATANAGNDAIVCQGSSYELAGAAASQYESLLWTTSGDGTFSDAQQLHPFYTPGPQDIQNGYVGLSLTAYAFSICDDATDAMVLNIQNPPVVNAGQDQTICESAMVMLTATASDYDQLNWTSTGDGVFSDAGALSTNYTPGVQDLANGSVQLCLEATGMAGCDASADCLNIGFQPLPTVNAGSDMTICAGESVNLPANAENQSSTFWSTTGDGTFTDFESASTAYIPGFQDIENGSVELCLTAEGLFGCGNATDCLTLTLDTPPTATAGSDLTVCSGNPVQLSGTTTGSASVVWTSSGDGGFENAEALITQYTPGAADLESGSVVLTLTAFAEGSCDDATDQLTVHIQPAPFAFAGDDATVEQGTSYSCSGANAANYASLEWATTGTGIFNNCSTLMPGYDPSNEDYTNGSVTLQLTVQPVNPCTVAATDDMTLAFDLTGCLNATANAGDDAAVCEGDDFTTSANAGNFEGILWETSGDGIFADASALNTVYTPGSADLMNGSVTLCLTAYAEEGCDDATDCMELSFQKMPVAHAGSDNTVPKFETYALNDAYAENYNLIQWVTTNGTGGFNNETVVNPVYQPGPSDWLQGWVELQMIASSVSPCTVSDDDILILTFSDGCQDATVDAGTDISACAGETAIQTGAAANYYTSLSWSTSGDGVFDHPNTLDPNYTLGPQDAINGSVTLTLSATTYDPCSGASDAVTITLHPDPVADAGTNVTGCGTSPISLTGTAENYTSTTWTTSGDGTFTDASALSTSYLPGDQDLANGGTEICLEANGYGQCQPALSCITVTLNSEPVSIAGDDMTICETTTAVLTGQATDYASVEWTTQGDGSFADATALQTTYSPGPADLEAGNVNLCLTAFGQELCGDDQSCLSLSFVKQPTAFAGADAEVEIGNTCSLTDASVTNAASVVWTTNGSGTFDDAAALQITYFPSADDYSQGAVILTLEASALDPCTVAATDSKLITFYEGCDDAVADAGTDFHACMPGDIILNGTAENYTTVIWETNGDGNFDDPGILQAVYNPGPEDLAGGEANLCLTAFADGDCLDATDCITVFFETTPEANAGEDLSVCITQNNIQLSGSATGYNTLAWSTSGDGTFESGNTLNPLYVPGNNDILNGMVTLTLTAGSEYCNAAADDMVLTIVDRPTAYAGENLTICEGDNPMLAEAFASHFASLEWTTSGDGYFDDPSAMNPVYYPGTTDIQNGAADLCLAAAGNGPCGPETGCMTITINPAPVATAGEDQTICETEQVSLNGFAENYTSILWTTSGDGNFDDPEALNNVYTPGTEDLAGGLVTITLTAPGAQGCTADIDELQVTIGSAPFVNAGADRTICETTTLQLNATAQNYTTLQWTTSGDGNFSNANISNPVYTPGTEDIQTGEVEVCLNAGSNGPCSDYSDCLIITIQPAPTVNAGEDLTICETSSFFVLSGQASFYSATNWFSNGDGTFDDASTLDATYYPGPGDLAGGHAEICLQAIGLNGCAFTEDCMTVTFQEPAVVDAGADAAICESEIFQLTGSAASASSILWTTNGDGEFGDASQPVTTYTPGSGDILNGNVELCLTANGLAGCTATSDCLSLTIDQLPVAFAGDNISICEGENVQPSATAEHYTQITWSTTGDGSFGNTHILNPVYTPGPEDLAGGTFELCLTATGAGSCGNTQDCMLVSVVNNPTAYAGEDATIEQGVVYTTAEATAENYSEIQWSTSGTGTFGNAATLSTFYTASPADYSTGAVTLTLSAQPENPCSAVAEDHLNLEFLITGCLDAIANAGDNAAVCTSDGEFQLSGSAENYESVLWTTQGDGSFDNASALNAIYSPGDSDIAAGTVDLCLTAFAADTCQDATDCMTLTLQKPPLAFAGTDNTIPKYEPYTLSDAYAEDYDLVQWVTTNGTGSFSSETVVNPTYNPGLSDWMQGYVELAMFVSAQSPCLVAADAHVIISFIDDCHDAVVNAGANINLCQGETLAPMNATALYFTGLNWTTTGDGSFDHPATLNPLYTLGENDITNGFVELYLEAETYAPCTAAVDTVMIVLHGEPLADAGSDITTCGDAGFDLAATAENYSALLWTSAGDGTFEDDTALNTSYIPGPGDLAAGTVELCLETQGYGACLPVTDCVTATLITPPEVDAGPDLLICESDTAPLNASAENYSTLLWETAGDGTFDDPARTDAVYAPGPQDIASGNAELCLTAFAPEGCPEVTDCLTLTIQQNPTADAGPDVTIEENQTYTLTAATATNASDVMWSGSGTGSFDNVADLHATYFPSAGDIAAGSVELSLSAWATDPCSVVAEDHMLLTIIEVCEDAVANAGGDFTACVPGNVSLTATAQNYVSVLWETGGDGTFTDPQSLNTEYIPGPQDQATMQTQICFTAIAEEPCSDDTDCITVSYTPKATVNAGEDIETCDTQAYVMLSGTADNFSDVQWSTTGTGSFVPANGLTAKYFMGYYDKLTGEVQLILTAENDLCGATSDTLTLTIHHAPVAFAGDDATICDSETFTTLEAFVDNATDVEWSTGGDGTFEDAGALMTTYYPGTADLTAGSVELCLSAAGQAPCAEMSDCMTLTLLPSAIVDAGADATICESETLQLNAVAENVSDLIWQTGGDGNFNDASILNPVYMPGPADIDAGEVILSLQAASSNNCNDASDDLTLFINKLPQVIAGQDVTICESETLTLNGTATDYTSVFWTSSGNGTFENQAALQTVYVPSAEDIEAGALEICLTATGTGSCDDATDCISVSIQAGPTASAGNDATICESEIYQLSGAATDDDLLAWNTSGDGSFDNPSSLTPVYTPGPEDIQLGQVTLCLEVTGPGGCGEASDCMQLTLQPQPVANAGSDATICESNSYTLQGSAENYHTILWQSEGDGSFDDATQPDATYTPGQQDLLDGSVVLCLSATGEFGCEAATDCMTLHFEAPPSAIAGTDMTICETSSAILNGEAENFATVAWNTSGDGIFGDPSLLNTTYTPGAEDLASGYTEICLTATGLADCDDALDCLTIEYQPEPVVEAGNDQTVCETAVLQLEGVASGYASIEWSTDGDGSFSDPASLVSTYMPGTADLEAGQVQICLSATGLADCSLLQDCLTLTFVPLPTAAAGQDITACTGEIINLDASATDYASVSWNSDGDGAFADVEALQTTYTPGPGDLAAGGASLCLSVTGQAGCDGAEDCLQLTITPDPEVHAGEDVTICESDDVQLNAMAENFGSLQWNTTGDGSFGNPALAGTQYVPGVQDLLDGTVELCLTAYGQNGCGESSDCITVSFAREAEANAGGDASILQGETYTPVDATTANSSGVIWSSSGTGTFNDATELHPTYQPTSADIASGLVTLTLTAEPQDPCTTAAVDAMELTIYITGCLDAEANAGEDFTACADESVYLGQASAFFYESLLWSTNGDGSFDDNSRLDATYTPGPADLAGGSVTLCLDAMAEGLCLDATDCVEVTFQPVPVAFAGSDNTIPKYETYTLGRAYAENYSLVQWVTTNGTGGFSDENVLNPVYQPGPSDWMQGYVELGIIAAPINPCLTSADDMMVLSFVNDCQDATVDAGADTLLICDLDSTIDVFATAAYYSGISWTTSGDGTFSHPNSLATQYTMGQNDLLAGEVTLYVAADGYTTCASAVDSVFVAPQFNPDVFAGNDLTICEGTTAWLAEAQAQYYSELQWTTAGDGIFDNPQILTAEYTPGAADITAGVVELTLTVESFPPCQIMASSSLTVSIDKLPEIVQDLQDQQVPVGSTVQFFVAAVDGKNYQWYGPQGMIAGADDPVFLISSADFEDIGNYHCVVYNDCGSASSNEATLTVYEHQIVEIPAGWSGISSYIDPYNAAVTNIFADVASELFIISNFEGMYFPGSNVNTLVLWNKQDGYQTKFDSPVDLEFKGLPNTDRSVDLTEGWNYLPVISECPVEIADVFGGNPHVEFIKEIAGNGVYWPIYGINSIGELLPGKAYFLRSNQNFTANFPECSALKGSFIANPPKPANHTRWNDVHYTPVSHVIALDNSLLQQLKPGDVLGAFTGSGICAGMAEIDANTRVMTIYGDDPLTDEPDGFEENEAISFRIYNQHSDEERAPEIEFENGFPNTSGLFATNGLSGIRMAESSGLEQPLNSEAISVYPNPTNGVVNISGLNSNSRIEVYNAEGQVLLSRKVSDMENPGSICRVDLSGLPSGLLYIRIADATHIEIQKIIRN